MDNLVFEESLNAEIEQSEFISKKWVYVNDNNNGNYSTQVVIDTTSIANSGAYVNWQEAYIVMPLILGVVCSVAGKITANTLSEAQKTGLISSIVLKNGFWNMIHSFNVEYNNQTVIQQTAYTNVYRSFKAHTSFSKDDLTNEAMTLGYYPDSSQSWSYDAAANAKGRGISNNDFSNNQGSFERIKHSYPGFNTQSAVMSRDARDNNFSSVLSPSTTGGKCFFKIYAKLRLKDLADFFGKTPLLKGSTLRLLINTNQVSNFQISYANVGDSINTFSGYSAQGQTNPIMIDTQRLKTEVLNVGGNSAGDFTFSLSIFKDNTSTATGGQSALSSCRLYAPVYKFNPIAEQRYLSLAPTKKVNYNDIFTYQFTGIGSNKDFNFLVSNGIVNIKSITVIPFLTQDDNGLISPHQSPYTSAPSTPDPIILNNFNVLVSGVNLFQQNQLYDYEMFNHELKSSNQLNGNLTTGLTSGLIGELEFSNLYRYYYGNCARILPSEEGVSRSVQIIGKNTSGKAIDLMIFVEFQKSIEIDISTGARIM